eukprot:scaffold211618_cov23-Cyclotella_meneghiniana.AAC.1
MDDVELTWFHRRPRAVVVCTILNHGPPCTEGLDWRGTWVLLDILLCDQPHSASLTMGDSFCYLVPAMEDPGGEYWNVRLKSAGITYGVGLGLLFLGVTMLWSGAWTPTATAMAGGSVIKDRAVTKRLAI